MVQKNNKWNISKEKGEEIAHKYIIEILKDSKNNTIPLSDLVILLNQRTKHIKFINKSKKKPISVYLRCSYGNMINFFDNFSIYGLLKQGANIQVKLLDNQIIYNKSVNQHIFQEYKEWVLIDYEDFIIV